MTAPASFTASEWMVDALCAQAGGDAWFPGKAEQALTARAVCAACPCKAVCLQFALDNDLHYYGIYGGLTPRQRQKLRKEQAA